METSEDVKASNGSLIETTKPISSHPKKPFGSVFLQMMKEDRQGNTETNLNSQDFVEKGWRQNGAARGGG